MKTTLNVLLCMVCALASAEMGFAGPIQDALNKAAPGDTVEIPAGVYAETVVVPDHVTLMGSGAGETVLDGGGSEFVVQAGAHAAIMGFTIRNGGTLVYNAGRYIGVFECDLEGYSAYGIRVEGGSAAIANNRITSGPGATGIGCLGSNPYIGLNVVQGNLIGVLAQMQYIPVLDRNVFAGNEVAIEVRDGARVLLTGNRFGDNRVNLRGQEADADAQSSELSAADLEPIRGNPVEAYRDLMREVFVKVSSMHPKVIYDLPPTPGLFHLGCYFPWATFHVSASARDTRIESYDAYDRQTDGDLRAAYQVLQGYPTVNVANPDIKIKELDRYVLEKIFVHPGSYYAQPDGKLVFDRITNLTRKEIILPAGYAAVEMNPGATVEQRGDRQAVLLTDMGITRLRIVIQPVGP
jgi:hypothetical protein